MKKLILFFLFIAVGCCLGYWISQDAGYVLIRYRNTTFETSLWLALFITITSFLIIYFLLRLIHNTVHTGKKIARWHTRRKEQKHQRATFSGLLQLVAGNWSQAQKTLMHAARHSPSPLLNHLAAAFAAQQQSKYHERDNIFSTAPTPSQQDELTLHLVQAQLQIQSHQWEQAYANLEQVLLLLPKHRHALQLLQQVYQALQEWDKLLELMPILKKQRILTKDDASALELQCLSHVLATKNTELVPFWYSLPKSIRTQPELQLCFTQACIRTQHYAEAKHCIEQALARHWVSQLVTLFLSIPSEDTSKQLDLLIKWHNRYPQEPEILIALATQYRQAKFYEKSKQCLTRALELAPSVKAYHVMAQIMEDTNDVLASQRYLNQALQLAYSANNLV